MKFLSQTLTNFFINQKIIKMEEKEVYSYSFQLFFAIIANLLMVALITLVSRSFLSGTTYLILFMIMRKTIGGYHAKTSLRCMITFAVIYSSFLWLVAFLPKIYYFPILVFASIFSLIINFSFAPLEDENKSLTEKERKRLGLKSKILTGFFCALLIFLGFFTDSVIGVSIGISMITSSASVLVKVLIKKFNNKI